MSILLKTVASEERRGRMEDCLNGISIAFPIRSLDRINRITQISRIRIAKWVTSGI